MTTESVPYKGEQLFDLETTGRLSEWFEKLDNQ